MSKIEFKKHISLIQIPLIVLLAVFPHGFVKTQSNEINMVAPAASTLTVSAAPSQEVYISGQALKQENPCVYPIGSETADYNLPLQNAVLLQDQNIYNVQGTISFNQTSAECEILKIDDSKQSSVSLKVEKLANKYKLKSTRLALVQFERGYDKETIPSILVDTKLGLAIVSRTQKLNVKQVRIELFIDKTFVGDKIPQYQILLC